MQIWGESSGNNGSNGVRAARANFWGATSSIYSRHELQARASGG
jgi:hypothetical protein